MSKPRNRPDPFRVGERERQRREWRGRVDAANRDMYAAYCGWDGTQQNLGAMMDPHHAFAAALAAPKPWTRMFR